MTHQEWTHLTLTSHTSHPISLYFYFQAKKIIGVFSNLYSLSGAPQSSPPGSPESRLPRRSDHDQRLHPQTVTPADRIPGSRLFKFHRPQIQNPDYTGLYNKNIRGGNVPAPVPESRLYIR